MHDKVEETKVGAAGDKLGYAFTYIQDLGNGMQVQVNFGLVPGAPKEAMDAELDKLREALSRQRAHATLRDTEAKLGAERKMAAALQHQVDTYTATMQGEIEALEKGPRANQNVIKGQIDGMRAQVQAYTQNKLMEKHSHETNIAIAEAVIAGARKELGLAPEEPAEE